MCLVQGIESTLADRYIRYEIDRDLTAKQYKGIGTLSKGMIIAPNTEIFNESPVGINYVFTDLTGVPTTTTDPSFPIEGLSTTNNPSGGTVGYFYSADDGATWTAFKPSAGIPVSGTMKIKAKIAAAI
jgi:hypothetical protein